MTAEWEEGEVVGHRSPTQASLFAFPLDGSEVPHKFSMLSVGEKTFPLNSTNIFRVLCHLIQLAKGVRTK